MIWRPFQLLVLCLRSQWPFPLLLPTSPPIHPPRMCPWNTTPPLPRRHWHPISNTSSLWMGTGGNRRPPLFDRSLLLITLHRMTGQRSSTHGDDLLSLHEVRPFLTVTHRLGRLNAFLSPLLLIVELQCCRIKCQVYFSFWITIMDCSFTIVINHQLTFLFNVVKW